LRADAILHRTYQSRHNRSESSRSGSSRIVNFFALLSENYETYKDLTKCAQISRELPDATIFTHGGPWNISGNVFWAVRNRRKRIKSFFVGMLPHQSGKSVIRDTLQSGVWLFAFLIVRLFMPFQFCCLNRQ